MRGLIITLLGFSLVALGGLLAQSETMHDGAHRMESTPMPHEGMQTMHEETMTKGEAKMSMRYTVPSDAELMERLTPLQYQVTRHEGTEPAFNNAYWNNHEEGLYVDIISGVPLFSSRDKYDSGTGWPSFTKPIDPEAVVEKKDRKFFMVRTEIRAKLSDAHLGHVFDDGPKPTGLRYCMNSAALRFIPKADLEKEGYGAYLKLFE